LQIIMLNLRQEVAILAASGNDTAGTDDCSDVMLSSSKPGQDVTALLGHNEDNTQDTVNTTYFVQAKLVGPSVYSFPFECHGGFLTAEHQLSQQGGGVGWGGGIPDYNHSLRWCFLEHER